jgi:3-oxoacyl-(acyl-carrier-protein) synthase
VKQPRVAITGIGVVSTFGAGRETFWNAIRRGQSGTRAITDFDASTYPCKVAAPVPAVDMSAAVALDG